LRFCSVQQICQDGIYNFIIGFVRGRGAAEAGTRGCWGALVLCPLPIDCPLRRCVAPGWEAVA
jgi:hypothetical protein